MESITGWRRAARLGAGPAASLWLLLLLSVPGAARASDERGPELSPEAQKQLRASFSACVTKLKGPYTENFCLCGGKKIPVRSASGAVGQGCKDPTFCAAYRAAWAEDLARHGMYIANIFSRDLYHWDDFPDHGDLVRGYVLEKHFVETHPEHKLARLKQFRGLSSAETEAPAQLRFFERYLTAKDFDPARDFLLAVELQKRFFVRSDVGQVQKVRQMATRAEDADPKFKPLKDAIHNQISEGLLPELTAYRDKLAQGGQRSLLDEIIAEIRKLTSLDESALDPQIAEIEDAALRARLAALRPKGGSDPVVELVSLADLMVLARRTVEARQAAAGDLRRLVDLEVTAANVVSRRAGTLAAGPAGLTARQHAGVLAALANATYGLGLLTGRELEAAQEALGALAASSKLSRKDLLRRLEQVNRVVEWAQGNAQLAFGRVWAPWTLLLPEVASVVDDVLRGSPLLHYAAIAQRLETLATGGAPRRHVLFGAEVERDVRALNPGLAQGILRVAPKAGDYTREEVVALPETPTDLEPAAGILTRGEGNVLSHVQLLARALGIPNVVLGPEAYRLLEPHAGQRVFFLVTPGGRVILKDAAAATEAERAVAAEFTRNDKRSGDGALGGSHKLHIDKAKIDLGPALPIDLAKIRRKDSGRICGPKAAFLGELEYLFPERVARGVVLPFGAYHQHYQRARVAVPAALAGQALATPGEPLPGFVERTYAELFGKLVPAGKPERELSAWIAPRLQVIQHSIRETPLSQELRAAIRSELGRVGLLLPNDPTRTVGCFIRSDTNVEDLDNFNGAGLNLTLFNRKSLDDIYEAVKEVWASPFSMRSFSWRQTLIDEPLWVLPSIVILESIGSDKSGVLVTADVDHGEPGKMLVATSEGVGGAVAGTSAETLLWSEDGVELVTSFKSPWRNVLLPGGGSEFQPASGRDHVLEPAEIEALVGAGRRIQEELDPALDPAGRPRPWDVEFGFVQGRLWLFQSRPFIGNESLKNIPALAALEGDSARAAGQTVSLEEVLR